MPAQRDSLPEKLQKIKQSAQKLPSAAAKLNSATDQLGKAIAELDAILKRFSLGIPTWVTFSAWRSDIDDQFSEQQIGYAKVGGKWGIAIKTISGDYSSPDGADIEQWPFSEAPRLLRVNSIGQIPELLEAIIEAAANMTTTISEKTDEVGVYASEIRTVLDKPIEEIFEEGLGITKSSGGPLQPPKLQRTRVYASEIPTVLDKPIEEIIEEGLGITKSSGPLQPPKLQRTPVRPPQLPKRQDGK